MYLIKYLFFPGIYSETKYIMKYIVKYKSQDKPTKAAKL